MALIKGAKRCFEWLQTKSSGDVVSRDEVLEATGWIESSLNTYLKKNKLAPFLMPLNGDQLKVVNGGGELSARWFEEVFTQKGPRHVNLSAGDRLTGGRDAYLLQEPLGQGAVGHVWSARKASTPDVELVAVKIMLPKADLLAPSRITNVRQRFRRECLNGAALDHDRVVRYLDSGDVQGNPFLVMELGEESVGQRLERDGAMTLEDAAYVVLCALEGLRYLHGKDMPHRDVKPDNLLYCDGQVKLGDLGIVKWNDFDRTVVTGGTITRSDMQLGSWFYMAPEQQADPHVATAASDIYALGISWIELLSGQVPSPHSVGAQKYPAPSSNAEVCGIIQRMVSYSPEDRPSLDEVHAIAGSMAG